MDLQKLFVLVSAANTEAFKNTYVSGGDGRNKAYDNKIVFLEGTSEIFTKGHIYGMSTDQAAKLAKIISSVGLSADGSLPAWGADADSIKDAKSIIAAVVALDAKAKALQTALDGEKAKVAASKTLTDAYEFSGSIKYVDAKDGVAAHIALCDEDGKELSTVPVSNIIGNGVLKTSVYDAATGILTLTFAQADGTEKAVEVDLKAMLDINDMSIAADSTNYLKVDLGTVSTEGETQAVFGAKVKKIVGASESADLTGLADAADVKAYVDSKVAGKNVSAEGDSYVSATATDNKVTVAAQIGNMVFTAAQGGNAAKLEGTAGKLVDSGAAATAIKGYADAVVAKEAADRAAAITTAIEALDVPAQTKGTNVHVTVSEADGKVALDSVVENYATVTYKAAEGDNKEANLTVANGSYLAVGNDIASVKQYVDAHVAESVAAKNVSAESGNLYITAGATDNKVTVTANVGAFTYSGGKVSGEQNKLIDGAAAASAINSYVGAVIAQEVIDRDAAIDNAIKALDVTSTTAGTGNVTVTYSETDGKVSISEVAVKMATVAYGVASVDGAASLSVSNGTQLATGDHITEVKKYVDAVVAAKNVSAEGDTGAKKFINATAANNKVTVTGTYASISDDKYDNGLVDGDFVKAALGNLWEEYKDA